MKDGISLGNGVLWVFVWLGFMLLYTFLDVAVWRKMLPAYEKYLNVITVAGSIIVFLRMLMVKNSFKVELFQNISFLGILIAIGCAILLYFLLDRGLDPVFERAFPASEQRYQETMQSLSRTPIVSFIQVGVLAPVIEEILIRDFLLQGLSIRYGNVIALLVSSLVFALLHFNMVQTISAFVCGIILGLLYLHTGSILCCIITHAGYNFVSYVTTIYPLFNSQ